MILFLQAQKAPLPQSRAYRECMKAARPKYRNLLLLIGVAASLQSACSPRKSEQSTRPSTEVKPLTVSTHKAARSTMTENLPAFGALRADESVEISAELAGRLLSVHFQEGTDVPQGELLFKLDDATYRAQLARLTSELSLARLDEERQKDLLRKNATSQQEYDVARNRLESAQAELREVEVLIARTEIRAPFAGRVGLRRVSVGAWITPGTPLTSLQDIQRLKLDFTLPERYLSAVHPGLGFTFEIEGRPGKFPAEITAIEPRIVESTRSIAIRARAANPDGNLLPGAFASIHLEVSPNQAGVSVPTISVIPSLKGYSVFVVEEGKAVERAVRLGIRSPNEVQILDGINEGDDVITSNLLRVRPGAVVTIQPESSITPPTP